MEETVKQRLVKYLKQKGIGQNKFEKLAGISSGYISNLKHAPKESQLMKILQAAPDINRVWLLTGEGEMLNKTEVSPVREGQTHVKVPLVSQYAYAGYLGGFADQEYLETLPTIDFIPDREMTGNYLGFEVRGDSMDDGSKDSYEQGEILVCREVEPYNWKNSPLHFNKRDFVIVHSDGILVKRIISHDVNNHTIVIHSLNPEYPDRTLDLADVRQIFSIIESRKQRRR